MTFPEHWSKMRFDACVFQRGEHFLALPDRHQRIAIAMH
jgi:hypothetical protein